MSAGSFIAAVQRPIEEFIVDPALTIASVLLVVVSAGWIVVWRLIIRDAKRAAMRGRRLQTVQSPRDIWSFPP